MIPGGSEGTPTLPSHLTPCGKSGEISEKKKASALY